MSFVFVEAVTAASARGIAAITNRLCRFVLGLHNGLSVGVTCVVAVLIVRQGLLAYWLGRALREALGALRAFRDTPGFHR